MGFGASRSERRSLFEPSVCDPGGFLSCLQHLLCDPDEILHLFHLVVSRLYLDTDFVLDPGEIQLGLESVNVALPFARAGKLKIIALTGGSRISLAPDIPTVAETLPGFDLGIWQSVVAPAKTPPEIVDLLHDEIVAVLSRESVRNKLTTQGVEPAVSESPQAFAKFIRSQAEVRSKVIKAVGIKLD